MIIVFIAGMTSGVVRWGTLALRILFAFSMTSAASYFLMMLFDYYDEMKLKKLREAAEALEAENAPPVEEAETLQSVETPPPVEVSPPVEQPPSAPSFQPSTFPSVGK
ncbi:MAG: hypothetical protein J5809_01270 [Selenomonadaceae bacterium]|nr:hypothetical protein [Selenomonadaceae bacterium]